MGKLSDQEKIECVNLYKNGSSCSKIGKIFGLTNSGIQGILKRRGIILRDYSSSSCQRKYQFDTNIFAQVASEETAYWLGFIAADGCVHARGQLTLELSSTDIGHLHKFQSFLKSNHSIYHNRGCSRVVISSPTLVSNLRQWGIVPRKTSIIQTPQLPSDLMQHYYRGFFDGDGWITQRYYKGLPKFEIGFSSGSVVMINEIREWVSGLLLKAKGTLISREKPNQQCWQLCFGGNISTFKIITKLYQGAGIFLDRKYEKAQFALEIIKVQTPSVCVPSDMPHLKLKHLR